MLSEDERNDLIADINFQQGRDYERERIIGLLESQSLIEDACKESPEACSCHLLIPTVQFIKLIREQVAQH